MLAHRPAAVVIIAGVNDVYQGRAVEHVTTQLRAMYGRARAARIPVVAGTIVPYNTATAGSERARCARSTGGSSGGRRPIPNVVAVDTRRAAAAADNVDRLAGSPDGLHPDIDGYRRMAEVLAPAIAGVIPRREHATGDTEELLP